MKTAEPEITYNKPGLSGSLGVTSIVLMVVATAAPLTVMVANTPLIISMGNGAAAPFDALVATVIMFLFSVGFIYMSRYITNAGAFYSYIQKGLGRSIGLGSATMAVISYFMILVALEAYIGFALSQLLSTTLGITISWWVLALAITALVGVLGYQKIELSSKFLGVALVLEILIVLVVDAAIIGSGNIGSDAMQPFFLETLLSGSPGLGIMFAIYCFTGFESTVVYREEAANPNVTIPKATYIAVFMIGIFYAVSMWCQVNGIGLSQVVKQATDHPGDMYLTMVESYTNKVFVDVMQVLLVTSLFACVLSLHNIVVRYQYVLGRFGVLHSKLGSVHEKHGSPFISSVLQTVTSLFAVAVCALIGMDPVTQIYAWGATAGTLGYMAILSLTCVSVLVFFRRTENQHPYWNTVVAPIGGLLGLASCLIVAVQNLPALIGGDNSNAAASIMEMVVMISFVVGCAAAFFMKVMSPARFALLKQVS
ncbi:APC family permease [Pseudomonas fluorescens]|uniref:APC family permease n=1 Tax=Pseudomonas fluorescens TaxID=294 RepID=A0A327MPA4_PSEFL|nr:APC family permease [Pseudomonas fluorescens]RAI64800.1 APC family permease [Pseudomonas fluorescens]